MVSKTVLVLGFGAVKPEEVQMACGALAAGFGSFLVKDRLYDFSNKVGSGRPVNAKACLPTTYLSGVEKAVPDSFFSIAYRDGCFRLELEGHDVREEDLDMIYALKFKEVLETTLGQPVRIEHDRPPRRYASKYALSKDMP